VLLHGHLRHPRRSTANASRERYPTTTAAGNLALTKFNVGEMADLYKQLVAGLVLATAKEAFALARA
jgi:hypothetical protein